MPDLADGQVFLMQGAGAKPYELKNTGGDLGRGARSVGVVDFGETGRVAGVLGRVAADLAAGERISCAGLVRGGTWFSDKERENPPAIGATVLFRYQELSDGGVPRFPSFSGVWEEI